MARRSRTAVIYDGFCDIDVHIQTHPDGLFIGMPEPAHWDAWVKLCGLMRDLPNGWRDLWRHVSDCRRRAPPGPWPA
jgi:hypothetical protein